MVLPQNPHRPVGGRGDFRLAWEVGRNWPLLLLTTGLMSLGACGQTDTVQSELTTLEQTFLATNAPGGDQSGHAPIVQAALAAVREDDFAGGVVALQAVQRSPNMTADQLRVVHDAMRSLTSVLVERAARGDAKAKAQLAVIERTLSQ